MFSNSGHANKFYGTQSFVGECQVLVFNFSFEITTARLNLCDGPGLDPKNDSF